jgi:ABC-type multidrug transport system fused ATPase/permease subunit
MSGIFPYLKFLSQYWKGERKNIALIFIFVILSASLSLVEPVFFANIIDQFLRDPHNLTRFPTDAVFYHRLALFVVGWISVAFFSRTFKNLQLYFVGTVSDRIGIRIFEHAYSHLLKLPMSFHAKQRAGEVFRKVSKARDDVTALFGVMFDKVFQNSFSIVVVLVVVLVKSWRIGLPLFGFVPVFFLVTWFFTKRIRRTQREINQINEKLFGSSFEAINHIELVKAFSTEEKEQEFLHHDNAMSHMNLKKKTVSFQSLGFAQGTVVNAARVVLLWYGTILAFRGMLSFGSVVLFNFYSFYIYQPLYELGDIYSKYHEGIAAVDQLQTILEEPIAIKDKAGAIPVTKLRGKVEFQHVNFSYNDEREILRDVSFVVEPGRKLALVGPSGSGKSTIVKLLLRFYEPTAGRILIDDKPIEDYELSSLYRRIGLVLQDTVLFNTTLEENIRYGTFDADENKVREVAHRASLEPLLKLLPQGLKTLVGERGLKVSGGEKQRVAIARSIIKQPEILIFDEATSALDSTTESEILKNIRDVSKGVTTVAVAHRLATVIESDEILLLKAGAVIERGSHDQLMAGNGEYARLYRLQTQREEGS